MMSEGESEQAPGPRQTSEWETQRPPPDSQGHESESDHFGSSTELSPSLRAPEMEDRSAEEGDPQTMPPAPPTPPTKRKSKFSGIGKFFKPWKWRKRKTSDTFRETSEVLERKISMRKPREELVKRGVLIEVPEEDVPVISDSPTLRNGHTNVVPAEPQKDEVVLKRNGEPESAVHRPTSEVNPVKDVFKEPTKQPLLPPKRPLSTSSSITQEVHKEQNVDSSPTISRTANSAPSPAPRTKLPPPVAHKQPPIPPPKPQNRNSNPLMAELSMAVGGSTLTPAGSRPSPPLPNKRGFMPHVDNVVNKEKTARPASLPPLTVKEVPAPPPPPPSPPLPFHSPPSPTQDAPFAQPIASTQEEKEQIPNVPLLPLHIRIQQALSSPQPISTLDNSQRAHSLLFVANDGGTGEEKQRVRSLPVTIELLKVPDDDDDDEVSLEDDSLSPEHPDHAPRVYIGDVPSVTVIPSYIPSCVQEEDEEDNVSDSDSEGPILYKEEDDDDDEEEETSSLANKVKRKDTLAMKLSGRSGSQESSTEIPHRSREEWTQIREQIGSQLNRRLSQRPTAEELEQRNILIQNEADRLAEKREIKRRLTRKLSQRPTVAELLERKILRFNEYVEVTDAHDYDRRADKPWTKLTPADKAAIRKELNDFKSTEMAVHAESKHYTRFHRP
ncbi:phosphatase and actin regulator 4 isoform X1 [Pelobates fuscus]|uniref:phosphatase and actin regulator 4 isoform X1 n=2 Tax=Pelobates fuscus TaxID=191477 RepID=UPI002FE46554